MPQAFNKVQALSLIIPIFSVPSVRDLRYATTIHLGSLSHLFIPPELPSEGCAAALPAYMMLAVSALTAGAQWLRGSVSHSPCRSNLFDAIGFIAEREWSTFCDLVAVFEDSRCLPGADGPLESKGIRTRQ